MNERQLLSFLKNPYPQFKSSPYPHRFIVNMLYAFQDRENLYLFMDFLSGGDLRLHLSRQKKFTEDQTSTKCSQTRSKSQILEFFVASIVAGLEYIHANGIIHRDIKPENLVFDSRGYIRTTDFGIARVWRPDNAVDTSGTPGYMGMPMLNV